MVIRVVLTIILGIPVLFLTLHTAVRAVRHFYKFPMPEFAANLIDNPLRRKIQPPDEMPHRHGIKPGMNVMEVGPGNGTYTLAAARVAGGEGIVTTIDIEHRMIDRVNRKIEAEGIRNIEAKLADVFELPFPDGNFDVVYMIAVIGEIPTPRRAIVEFHRVLKPGGSLAFSEILLDPDYPLAGRLIKLVQPVGFKLQRHVGNFFSYTICFSKVDD